MDYFRCRACETECNQVIQSTLKWKENGKIKQSEWEELCIQCFYIRMTAGAVMLKDKESKVNHFMVANRDAMLLAMKKDRTDPLVQALIFGDSIPSLE